MGWGGSGGGGGGGSKTSRSSAIPRGPPWPSSRLAEAPGARLPSRALPRPRRSPGRSCRRRRRLVRPVWWRWAAFRVGRMRQRCPSLDPRPLNGVELNKLILRDAVGVNWGKCMLDRLLFWTPALSLPPHFSPLLPLLSICWVTQLGSTVEFARHRSWFSAGKDTGAMRRRAREKAREHRSWGHRVWPSAPSGRMINGMNAMALDDKVRASSE